MKASRSDYLAVFTAIMVGLLFCSDAVAHKVRVFAYVEGDKLIVEGYFSKSAKARNSLVSVYDSEGNKVFEARTDAQGVASFKLAQMPSYVGDLKVVLDVGHGHKALYTVAAAELPGFETNEPREISAFSKKEEPKPSLTGQPNHIRKLKKPDPALEDQIAMIEKVIDKKLKPIIKMLGNQQRLLLAQQDRGTSLSDVVGGIGWIFGIVGVAAYILSRKQANKK